MEKEKSKKVEGKKERNLTANEQIAKKRKEVCSGIGSVYRSKECLGAGQESVTNHCLG